tara:strand:- start:1837 stop:2547 length:711 start_codon:yes stop_codon:yes gene_type:complete
MPEPQVKTLEIKSTKDKYKEASKKQKDKDFREKEKKSLTKSIGTAGPKVRPDGTTKDDKPKVTAKQKEEFRQQEETYLTKSPGTVGDKYYKNPEGTGTGQGGSGIPVETKTAQTKPAEVFQPQEIIYIEMPSSQDKDEVFSLKSFVDKTPESSTYISEPNRILYNSGGSTNRLDVAQTSFFNLAEDLGSSDPTRVSFSVRPRTRGTLFRNFGITGADASVNIPLPNKGRSLFGGDT